MEQLIAAILIIGLVIAVGTMKYQKPTKAPDKVIKITIRPEDFE